MTSTTDPQPDAALLANGMAAVVPAGVWQVDPTHSSISFAGRYLGVVTMRGRFGRFSGDIIATEPPNHSVATMSIDAATITTGVARYDEQLRSEDFLDVARFPTITFRSTYLEAAGPGWQVTGDLTIRDITEPVTTRVSVDGVALDPTLAGTTLAGRRAGMRASVVVDRERFGLTWNMNLPGGGLLLSKTVDLELALCAVLQTQT
jgi:polyisoprenoid-binding protein YceI